MAKIKLKDGNWLYVNNEVALETIYKATQQQKEIEVVDFEGKLYKLSWLDIEGIYSDY